jgi:PPIC-type PPIASE domain
MTDAAHTFGTTPVVEADTSNADSSEPLAKPTRLKLPAAVRAFGREPLVHFALLGALIFGIDASLRPPAKDDKVITVTKAMRQSFIDNFDEDKERVPADSELAKMIDSWIASEILYREGKALGVDRGDDMIRDRVAFKLQLLIFDQVRVAQPTEEQLRAWFAANHERFDEPEEVGFYLTPATDEATARHRLEDIVAQRETEELRNQTRAILGRPVASLSASFGEGFRDALLGMPQGQWSVAQSREGWHVVRLDSRRPGALANFETVREDAAKIWHTEETRKQAWEAVNRLKANYKVQYER